MKSLTCKLTELDLPALELGQVVINRDIELGVKKTAAMDLEDKHRCA